MKSYIERKDESMANTSESKKLKFASLEEAKEYLLQSKEQNVDVSQKGFLDAVSALNLDDDTMDDLYNWIDENLIEFIDGEELEEDEVLDDDLSEDDLDEEDSIAEEISQLEKIVKKIVNHSRPCSRNSIKAKKVTYNIIIIRNI